VTRLCEGTGPNANNALAAGVLATVGELAKVVGLHLFLHLWCLCPHNRTAFNNMFCVIGWLCYEAISS